MDKTNGSPVNACCECPAGKGPSATCKHIAAVMLMLQHLLDTGEIKVEKSCTEDLQTFHRPKAFYNGIHNDDICLHHKSLLLKLK